MTVKQRQIVPSGSFVVSGKHPLILDAYLGSCVGVALWDSEAGTGGIHHLLLPEPVDGGTPWQPEKYARTGLPLFIQALCDLGAQKNRLKATMAGGGLIGPASQMDLDMDIGGRTTEMACHLLEKAGIQVLKKEIGGYFTCRMSLDLSCGDTTITPVIFPDVSQNSLVPACPTPEQITETIQSIKPIPQIALKLLRMIHNDMNSLGDVAKEVRQDQVISAKVLKLCNSAMFSRKMNTDSIDRALILLGEKRFLLLVLSAAVDSGIFGYSTGYSLCRGGLYNHSLGMALACERLAKMRSNRISPAVAYTAGLLHDIGKVVLDQYVARGIPFFYRRILEDGEDLIAIEKECFDTTHAETGRTLAELWELPDILKEPIACHHEPESAQAHPELTHLVFLADLIQSRFTLGQDLEGMVTCRVAESLEVLGFSLKQLPALIDAASVIV
ncbi:MAG: HDOD domain-containing protein [Desulfotignum sp.]|nr:HDOD domain-containing protein [Desulfotignum sp.]MCF8086943.1 HDOD domain-containing protein [Desulfotignum sp.]MCF8137195.1 HDOD domain-containing protein [Desulfotignum sp.]